jgi:hypothetical protein
MMQFPFLFFGISSAKHSIGALQFKGVFFWRFRGVFPSVPGLEALFLKRLPQFQLPFSGNSLARFLEHLHHFLEAQIVGIFGSFAPDDEEAPTVAWWAARSAAHHSRLFSFVIWCFPLLQHCFSVTLSCFGSGLAKAAAGPKIGGVFPPFLPIFGVFAKCPKNFSEFHHFLWVFHHFCWNLVSPCIWPSRALPAASTYQFGFHFGVCYSINASCARTSPFAFVGLVVWNFLVRQSGWMDFAGILVETLLACKHPSPIIPALKSFWLERQLIPIQVVKNWTKTSRVNTLKTVRNS